MNKLVDNLLEYSRSGRLNEELAKINLPETIEKVKQTFSKDLENHNASIHFKSDVHSITVYPTLFSRLLNNLVSNAIKYRSEKDLEIFISCTNAGNYYDFSVADNGIGIEENQFENIFKIFKSVEPSKENNGIGLSVCKKIVEMHKGDIWVESELDKGSTFKFRIYRY